MNNPNDLDARLLDTITKLQNGHFGKEDALRSEQGVSILAILRHCENEDPVLVSRALRRLAEDGKIIVIDEGDYFIRFLAK